MAKLGIPLDDLRRIQAHYLGWFELSDGQWENMPDPVDETVNHRRLPGEGEFPIRDMVAAVREAGYDGPWGVEVLSEEARNLPIRADLRPDVRGRRRPALTIRPLSPGRQPARPPRTARG